MKQLGIKVTQGKPIVGDYAVIVKESDNMMAVALPIETTMCKVVSCNSTTLWVMCSTDSHELLQHTEGITVVKFPALADWYVFSIHVVKGWVNLCFIKQDNYE